MQSFFSTFEIGQFRVLSYLDGWEITKPFGQKSRDLLAKLDPPCFPEDETLLFDCGISGGWGGPSLRVTQLTHDSITLTDGFFFATDSRLIWGNESRGVAYQIPYQAIKVIYREQDDYTLVLTDGSQVLIGTQIPRPSLLGAIAILGGSPIDKATISRMEHNKEQVAGNFVTIFSGFFTAIADENRSRRGTTTASTASPQLGVDPDTTVPSLENQLAKPIKMVATSPVPNALTAFQNPNFVRFFATQLISQIGMRILQISLIVFAFALTGSFSFFALLVFLFAAPYWIISFIGGPIVSRLPRRQTLMFVQFAKIVPALALFILYLDVFQIGCIVFALGLINAVEDIARQGLVEDLLRPEEVWNVVTLNSILYTASGIVGAIVGFSLASNVGFTAIALWSSVCFFVGALGLMVVRTPHFTSHLDATTITHEIRESVGFIIHSRALMTLMVIASISSIFGFGNAVLLPAYASEQGYTFSTMAVFGALVGIGGLVGALCGAFSKSPVGKLRLLVLGSILFPIALLFLLFEKSSEIGLLLPLLILGFGYVAQQVSAKSFVQIIAPESNRRGVLSLFTLLGWQGMQAIGGLQAYLFADSIGFESRTGVGAAMCLVLTLVALTGIIWLRRLARYHSSELTRNIALP